MQVGNMPQTVDPGSIQSDIEFSDVEFCSRTWGVNSGQPPGGAVRVQGRLRENLNYWVNTLRAPDRIVDTIQHGYVLPLFSPLLLIMVLIISQL